MKVVGIGTSAGGVEAMTEFLQHLPKDTGAAYVLIQHLSPDHNSIMDTLLKRETSMPVKVVKQPTHFEPDTLFLIPNDKNLVIKQSMLYTEPRTVGSAINLPIDLFFHSLGEAFDGESIGIILSGSGTDGARGMRTIKEKGGLVLVQSPESAKFESMPKSVIRLNIADKIDTPGRLAEILGDVLRTKSNLKNKLLTLEAEEVKSDFTRILELVGKTSKIDFSVYREPTIVRRLENRMLLHRCSKLSQYLNVLTNNGQEQNALKRDFLIGVTRFFRDKEVFEYIESVLIPQMVDNRNRNAPLRIWIAACSTGEEAYSVAMILARYLHQNELSQDFKIFASDINRASIEFASKGYFGHNIEADVPMDLLTKYFKKDIDGYQIVPELREKILFAVHDALFDPPFIRIDLISCRNFLIYLKPKAQTRVLTTFHGAINGSGVMLLGPSEALGEMKNAFHKIAPKINAFNKRDDIRLPGQIINYKFRDKPEIINMPKPKNPAVRDFSFADGQADPFTRFFVEQYAPTSIIINEFLDVFYINGNLDNILQIPRGLLRMNLKNMMNEKNLMIFKNGVGKVIQEKVKNLYKNVLFEKEKEKTNTDLLFQAIEFPTIDEPMILVEFTFKDLVAPGEEGPETEEIDKMSVAGEQIQMLEYELRASRNRSQKLVSELEATNEELHSSNRELLASNEELQSTNEELQSVNEELYTVNSEFRLKNEELAIANNDINNLLKSTGIGTIFLDNELRIRRFTPAIKKQFEIIATDIGRPITNFSSAFDDLDFGQMCKEVFESLKSLEREVTDKRGKHFLMRILPYRTESDLIKGLVITFIDIVDLVHTRNRLSIFANRYTSILKHSEHLYLVVSKSGDIRSLNKSFGKIAKEIAVRKSLFELVSPENSEVLIGAFAEVFESKETKKVVCQLKNFVNGKDYWFQFSIIPDTASIQPTDELDSAIVIMNDISEKVKAEKELEKGFQEYLAFMNNTQYQIALVDRSGVMRYLNYAKRVNKTEEEMIGTKITDYLTPEAGQHAMQAIEAIFSGEPFSKIQFSFNHADGQVSDVELFATPVIIKAGVKYVALVEYNEN